MNEAFTDADKNTLRDFVNTDTGKKFLNLLINQELAQLAEAYNQKTTAEKQSQLVSRVAGIYWTRTLIQDLITPKENKFRLTNN